jgi:diguanylate cyclase (GGDEF)-like protein/PAS domain S-box-containing protein
VTPNPDTHDALRMTRSLETIVNALPSLISYWDHDLICRYVNDACAIWLGRPAEQLIGITLAALLGPESFEQNHPLITAALNGKRQDFVRSAPRPDGAPRDTLTNYIPDLDETGRVLGFVALISDVTLLTAAESELRRREEELTRRLEQSHQANTWLQLAEQIAHIGHWHVDLRSLKITWSDEIYRIHGVDPAEHVPTIETAIDTYHPEDRPLVQALVARSIKDGTPFDHVSRLIRPDGDTRYVHSRGVTSHDENGTVKEMFGVFIDVTEQQRTEKALRDANEALEGIANSDALTGVANRRRFDRAFEQEWRAAMRNHGTLSIVLFDLDGFKGFSDRFGHQAGDEALRGVALAVEGTSRRPHDLVARYGGEEFIMLLPATDEDGAVWVAEQARVAVSALGIAYPGSPAGAETVTASFGVATARPQRADTPGRKQSIISEADAMLYVAKRAGRNRVESRLGAFASQTVPQRTHG